MTSNSNHRRFTRRGAFKLGAGAALAAGSMGVLGRSGLARASGTGYTGTRGQIDLIATDGWVALPLPAHPTKFFPDSYAPTDRTTYTFGFRDVSSIMRTARQQANNPNLVPTDVQSVLNQKGKTQTAAPLLFVDQDDLVTITLTNLGFQQRPDLTDGHTIHWHGFRNALSFYDGIPETSISVPLGRTFPYFFKPHDPGTYMYHCHFEDVEHVQMGMTGVVFVRPKQNKTPIHPGEKYVYNDAAAGGALAGSTRYDREFAWMIHEWYLQSHWEDAHIQQPDWSEFTADAWLLNGRSYPDTLQPSSGFNSSANPTGFADPRLAYQPISSVIRGNAGERVLLRMANLGYQQHTMTLPGLPFRVVGKDATLLAGRDGTDLSYVTDSVDIGPGEGIDIIITMPGSSGSSGTENGHAYDAYPFYDRNYANGYLTTSGVHAGLRTELRVFAPGALPAQTTPNA
jgi:FtsP/CotA-like multicopper oxidase with cupredoxin domain